MKTPGSVEWLAELAQTATDATIAQGLLRAAHRIRRLQREIAKLKTGVDPSNCLAPTLRKEKPRSYKYRLEVSEWLHDEIFTWINDSDYLGMGRLNSCTLVVTIDPPSQGGSKALPVKGISSVCDLASAVKIIGPTKTILLRDCYLFNVSEQDEIVHLILDAQDVTTK